MKNLSKNTPPLEITRVVQLADLQIIRDLAAEIWPETFQKILSPEQIKYMMQMMYSPEIMEQEFEGGYIFEIYRINHQPAGYTVCAKYELPGVMKLHKIYLKSQFQGCGIGSKMLQHVIENARNAGFGELRLNVNKHNTKAMNAYLRNGFREIAAVKIDIGDNFYMDDFVMSKDLNQYL